MPQPFDAAILHPGVQVFDDAPVGSHGHSFPRILCHDLVDGFLHPLVHLGHGFPLGKDTQVRGVVPVVGHLRETLPYLGQEQVFHFPYVNL